MTDDTANSGPDEPQGAGDSENPVPVEHTAPAADAASAEDTATVPDTASAADGGTAEDANATDAPATADALSAESGAAGHTAIVGAPGEQSGAVITDDEPGAEAVASSTEGPEPDLAAESNAVGLSGSAATAKDHRWRSVGQQIVSGSGLVSVLAIVVALVITGILIAATDKDVQSASGYFFARPADMLLAIWESVSGAFTALFQGSVINFSRDSLPAMLKPLTDTLYFATPLIAAGLGVALTFRVGMFNIGGRGQMLVASALAGWVSFAWTLPPVIHLLVALVAGIVGGAIWGGLAGFLKARTGAHEVILTIMLNFVALLGVSWALRQPGLLRNPNNNNPVSPPADPNAIMPQLLTVPDWMFGGEANVPGFIQSYNAGVANYNLHWGFLFAVAAVIVCWWLLDRSSLGFQLRALGLNPDAARMAGMNVPLLTTLAFVIAGGFMGIAGAIQVQGTVTTGFSNGIDAGIGFEAITVALLGRSTPWGTFWAAVLFGAFKAGGFRMQGAEQIPIDIVLVVQSLIVLFIAAPPLVRSIFGIPDPTRRRKGASK